MARYLIDGYNLLFSWTPPSQSGDLSKIRSQLLEKIHQTAPKNAQITIIFDAQRGPVGKSRLQNFRGIAIQFAKGKQGADALIGEIIDQDSAPKTIIVVSDDHEVQQSAKRCKAQILSSNDFFTHLGKKKPAQELEEGEKPTTADEIEFWMKAFEKKNE